MNSSDESILLDGETNPTIHGSMTVEGNLTVQGQTSTNELQVISDNEAVLYANSTGVSFKKTVDFLKEVQFNNGNTIIGMETTYNSAYVGSETIQAGERLVLGDSAAKWDVDSRKIIADTFSMTLKKLVSDNVSMKNGDAITFKSKDLRVTNEIIGQTIFAGTVKTNNFFMDKMAALNLNVAKALTVKDIIVNGSAKLASDLVVMGSGVNGAALTVNGGELIANKGIISNTRNNRFQTMEITGGGSASPAYCFVVDRGVDSLFQGNVTIEGAESKLILDGSTLATDNILVTPISQLDKDNTTTGVQLTTKRDWDDYRNEMVQEYNEDSSSTTSDYNPYSTVKDAIDRNRANYESARETVQSLVNPISYAMESSDPNVPKRFAVKNGVYRMDSNGNALVKNLVSEKGRFSELEAYKFNINKMNVDKLVTTSVASNVVDTDNLLKSRGLAEFDGTMNIGANMFIEEGAKVNVANGAKMTLQSGAGLELKDGATFTMGNNTSVKMNGEVELDINKIVFVDNYSGSKWRLVFRPAVGMEGTGTVVEYVKVTDEGSATTAQRTTLDARELDEKLKKLGM